MRSHTSNLKWESQLIAQTKKTSVLNGFISWPLFKVSENLGTLESLKSLETFRGTLTHFDCLQDFFWSLKVTICARWTKRTICDSFYIYKTNTVPVSESQQLVYNAWNGGRNILHMFNSDDKKTLRDDLTRSSSFSFSGTQLWFLCGPINKSFPKF